MAEAASNSTYDRLRAEGPAKPTTPDEVQEVAGFKINPLTKGYLTRSSIYERGRPKKTSQTKNKSRVKMSSMNKHKKRGFKAYAGQGR